MAKKRKENFANHLGIFLTGLIAILVLATLVSIVFAPFLLATSLHNKLYYVGYLPLIFIFIYFTGVAVKE
jgi:hypothetical protein